ncbi:MAG: hypothetical protein ACTS6G_06135 [Candidatus Hodgkinia cicadicola]
MAAEAPSSPPPPPPTLATLEGRPLGFNVRNWENRSHERKLPSSTEDAGTWIWSFYRKEKFETKWKLLLGLEEGWSWRLLTSRGERERHFEERTEVVSFKWLRK